MTQNYQIFKEWPHNHEYDDCDISIFQQQAYWDIQLANTEHYPLCVRNQVGDLIGFCCFTLKNEQWISPYNAPYSSIYTKFEVEREEIISLMIRFLQAIKPYEVELTPPARAAKKEKSIASATISQISINHHLCIDPKIDFLDLIKFSRKKRTLRQLRTRKLQATLLEYDEYASMYEVLLSWRKRKGHQKQMPLDILLNLKKAFPDRYFFLKLQEGEDTKAMAIYLLDRSDTLYTYILITDPSLKGENHSLLLWDYLYQHAQRLLIKHIDMGTSMIEQHINKGLSNYKSSIGGLYCKKYSWKYPC